MRDYFRTLDHTGARTQCEAQREPVPALAYKDDGTGPGIDPPAVLPRDAKLARLIAWYTIEIKRGQEHAERSLRYVRGGWKQARKNRRRNGTA